MPSEITVQDGWTTSMDINTVVQLDAVIEHLETHKRKASIDSWPSLHRMIVMRDRQLLRTLTYRRAFQPFKLTLQFFKQEDALLFKLSFVKPSDG